MDERLAYARLLLAYCRLKPLKPVLSFVVWSFSGQFKQLLPVADAGFTGFNALLRLLKS